MADDPDEALPKPRLCEKCAFHPRFGWMRDAAQKLRPGAELRRVRHLYDWLAEQDRKKK
jgi:hypothetical protein